MESDRYIVKDRFLRGPVCFPRWFSPKREDSNHAVKGKAGEHQLLINYFHEVLDT